MPAQRQWSLVRGLALLLPLAVLLTAAQIGTGLKPVAASMTEAAQSWLKLLSPEEKKVACYPFDHAERSAWYFVPLQDKDKKPTRKGLRLEVMNEAQKAAALRLVQTALSDVGWKKVETIMSLETLLAEQEKGKGPVRNPGWYFITIFGEPGLSGSWGWRIDGHHISLNLTLKDGQVVSVTPAFLGSNPGEVKAGDRQGTRPLGAALDRGTALVTSLTPEQRLRALQPKNFGEVQGQTTAAKVTSGVGIKISELSEKQQVEVTTLVEAYLGNFHSELQKMERQRVLATGWDDVYFAYSDPILGMTPLTYHLQGPRFLIEFLNVQGDSAGNNHNHYHTCWRNLPSDFGMQPAPK